MKPSYLKDNWIYLTSVSLIQLLLLAVFFFSPIQISFAQGTLSWSRPVDITQPSTSTDALYGTIVCDQYQNTHILWADRGGENADIYYRNDIQGDWSVPNDVLALGDSVAIRLSAAVSNVDNTLHLLWVNQWIRGDLFYSHAPLQDAGNPKAWSEPAVLATTTESGHLVVDKNGTLHVVYEATDSSGFEVGTDYIQSTDGGLTWSDPVSVALRRPPVPSSASPRIAVDGTGRLHVGVAVRSQEYGVYSEVGYIRSLDGGLNWEEYLLVDDTSSTFQGLAVMAPYAFGDNEIHLTWHEPSRMHMWSRDGGETWSQPVEVMSLGGAFGGPNALTQDSAGVVHIVTAVRGGVYSASWNGSEWSERARIDDRSNDPHGQTIEVCQGNKVQILYDDRNDTQKVWYSSAVFDAPRVDRQPLPTLQPPLIDQAPAATQTAAELTATQENSGPENLVSLNEDQPAPRVDPMRPIVVSVLPVLILIGVIFAFFRRR